MPCCMAVKGGCCASTVAMCVLSGVAVGLAVLLLLLGSSLSWHVCLVGALALLLAAAGLAVPKVLVVVGCAVCCWDCCGGGCWAWSCPAVFVAWL